MKKCETFGCSNPGAQMYQIAPGTNVWLCQRCVEHVEQQDQAMEPSPYVAPRKAT